MSFMCLINFPIFNNLFYFLNILFYIGVQMINNLLVSGKSELANEYSKRPLSQIEVFRFMLEAKVF